MTVKNCAYVSIYMRDVRWYQAEKNWKSQWQNVKKGNNNYFSLWTDLLADISYNFFCVVLNIDKMHRLTRDTMYTSPSSMELQSINTKKKECFDFLAKMLLMTMKDYKKQQQARVAWHHVMLLVYQKSVKVVPNKGIMKNLSIIIGDNEDVCLRHESQFCQRSYRCLMFPVNSIILMFISVINYDLYVVYLNLIPWNNCSCSQIIFIFIFSCRH